MRRWTVLGVVAFVAAPTAVFASAEQGAGDVVGGGGGGSVPRTKTPRPEEITRPIGDDGASETSGKANSKDKDKKQNKKCRKKCRKKGTSKKKCKKRCKSGSGHDHDHGHEAGEFDGGNEAGEFNSCPPGRCNSPQPFSSMANAAFEAIAFHYSDGFPSATKTAIEDGVRIAADFLGAVSPTVVFSLEPALPSGAYAGLIAAAEPLGIKSDVQNGAVKDAQNADAGEGAFWASPKASCACGHSRRVSSQFSCDPRPQTMSTTSNRAPSTSTRTRTSQRAATSPTG